MILFNFIDEWTLSRITILTIPTLFIMYLIITVYRQNSNTSGEPPIVWSILPYMGSGISFQQNFIRFLTHAKRKYGDTFTVTLAGKKITFLTNYLDWSHVFFKSNPKFEFYPFGAEVLSNAFGCSPSNSYIAEMDHQFHNNYSQYLAGSKLNDLCDTYNEHVINWIRDDKGSQNIGLYALIKTIAFSSSFQALFSKNSLSCAEMTHIQHQFEIFDSEFGLLAAGIPSLFTRASLKCRKWLKNQMSSYVLNTDSCSEIFEQLVKTIQSFPQLNMDDQSAYTMAFLWASQGNTNPAAFWCIYYILSDPKAKLAVIKELTDVSFRHNITDNFLTRSALEDMVVLESCICETLRMTTGSMTVRRVMSENCQINVSTGETFNLNKGDSVAIHPYLHHNDPEIFENPETFVYDRYLIKDKETKNQKITECIKHKNGNEVRRPYSLVSFGGGVSICPGRHFAKNEIKILVSLLLKHVNIEIVHGQTNPSLDLSRCGLGILPPKCDIYVSYTHM
jgi:cytochrome P450